MSGEYVDITDEVVVVAWIPSKQVGGRYTYVGREMPSKRHRMYRLVGAP